jgi:hypothetical protein
MVNLGLSGEQLAMIDAVAGTISEALRSVIGETCLRLHSTQ